MKRILAFVASAAVVLVATSANAWHVRHYPRGVYGYGYYGYEPQYFYAPRYHYGYYGYAPRFYESPMYAPDAPAARNFNNPGIPDFQLGARS